MGPVQAVVENVLVAAGKRHARSIGIPESDISAVCRKLAQRGQENKAGLERLMADADWVDANITQRGKDAVYRHHGRRIGRLTHQKSRTISKKPRPAIVDKKA